MSSGDPLIGVTENAHIGPVPNTYEGIKQMLRGGTLDRIRASENTAYYIDDNGMLEGLQLNFPATIFAGRVIYGPVVMTLAVPDDEGGDLPPKDEEIALMIHFCDRWHAVEEDARRTGQELRLVANPDTIPPPEVITFKDHDAMLRYLAGDPDQPPPEEGS